MIKLTIRGDTKTATDRAQGYGIKLVKAVYSRQNNQVFATCHDSDVIRVATWIHNDLGDKPRYGKLEYMELIND